MKYVETNAPREASKDDSRENDRLGDPWIRLHSFRRLAGLLCIYLARYHRCRGETGEALSRAGNYLGFQTG
jgi:hypothetical protein